ncbi:MAG TPA: hypothetical protein EYP89_00360, partial [Candidatus Omnitrophica bacterium]|nr:hypothetical protein [Candidatus Omnitrophota bacterium]
MKKYKPTTPARRHMMTDDFSILTKKEPERRLTKPPFEDLKTELKKLNRVLKENEKEIIDTGKLIYYDLKKMGIAINAFIVEPLSIAFNAVVMTFEGLLKRLWKMIKDLEDGLNFLVKKANGIFGIELTSKPFDFGVDKYIDDLDKRLDKNHKSIQKSLIEISGVFNDLKKADFDYTNSVLNNSKERKNSFDLEIQDIVKVSEEEIKTLKEFAKEFSYTPNNPYERLLRDYEEALAKYRGVAGSKNVIDEWYHSKLSKLNEKSLKKYIKSEEKKSQKHLQEYQKRHNIHQTYLENTSKTLEAWYSKEGDKLSRLGSMGLSQKKLNEVFQSDYKKFFDNLQKQNDKTLKIEDEFTKDLTKTFEDNFFNVITGKFHSFKDFLKSLFRDILKQIITPFTKSLSSSIANALVNSFKARGTFSSFGKSLLPTAKSYAIGSSVDKNTLISAGFKIAQNTNASTQWVNSAGDVISVDSAKGVIKSVSSSSGGGVSAVLGGLSVAKGGATLLGSSTPFYLIPAS